MGMGIGHENVLPGLVAAGTLFGTTVPAITLTAPYRCSTPVRTSAGLYTVVLFDKPTTFAGSAVAANIYAKVWALTDLTNVAVVSYTAATGILVLQIRTATTGAAVDGACGFEVVCVGN